MLISSLSCVLYLLASSVIVKGMFTPAGPNRLIANIIVVFALGLHVILLQSSIFAAPETGQNLSILNVASMVAWLISVTMMLASIKLPNTILLPVVYSFTGLIVLLSKLISDTHLMHLEVDVNLVVHITLSLFAYACLGIAFLYAWQLSYINLRLKEKNASMLHSSLPPLLAVENILFKLLLVGTILLTLSLLSGFIFLDNMFSKEQAHKTVLSLLAWAIYTATLIGHSVLGWRGKTVIWSTTVAGVLLTLAYFGSRFVREVLLNA
jgi:ABC-type uncharacterized transport system permease subunit